MIMERKQKPNKHGRGTLAYWLNNPKNRNRMYKDDKEDAVYFMRMNEKDIAHTIRR
jgi:hypothetical protein